MNSGELTFTIQSFTETFPRNIYCIDNENRYWYEEQLKKNRTQGTFHTFVCVKVKWKEVMTYRCWLLWVHSGYPLTPVLWFSEWRRGCSWNSFIGLSQQEMDQRRYCKASLTVKHMIHVNHITQETTQHLWISSQPFIFCLDHKVADSNNYRLDFFLLHSNGFTLLMTL